NAEAAWQNLQLAKRHADKCTPVEKDLIEALSARYANPQPEDRSTLDKAYADAMRKVWQKHPDDADVGAWFAESMMDLSPWNQWTRGGQAHPRPQGTPRPSRSGDAAEHYPPPRQPPLHPRDGGQPVPAKSRARRRPPARSTAGPGTQRPHAHAHRHPRRAVAEG